MLLKRKLYYLAVFIFLFLNSQNSFGLKIGENEVTNDPIDTNYKYYMRWYTGPKTKDNPDNHAGVDIVGEKAGEIKGANVYAVENGKVIYAAKGKKGTGYGGYGNVVAIKHDGFITVYAHLKDIKTQKGKSVNAGDTIGTVGNTGKSTGPHLHYEVRNTNKIDEKTNPLGQVYPGDYENEDYTKAKREKEEETGGGDDSWDGEDGRGDGEPGTGPGGDNPDDNESFSSSNPNSLSSDSKARYYRLAAKKEKSYILHYWNYKKLLEERDKYFESLGSGGTPDETYLNNLNSKINEIYNLLTTNILQFRKERAETPDVVILRNGYFRSTSSLTNKFSEAWKRVPSS
ncbi:MAG: M23 family metallopeptidase, partial [Methanosarcinales archaeon]